MSTCEEILREIYRLVREEGYDPDLCGIEAISLSPEGYGELLSDREGFTYLEVSKQGYKSFMSVAVKINRRQKVKFRVIC